MKSQEKKIAKKRGRPATGTSPTVGVRIPAALITRLDNWRRQQRDLPSRPEAIRRLLEYCLSKQPRGWEVS